MSCKSRLRLVYLALACRGPRRPDSKSRIKELLEKFLQIDENFVTLDKDVGQMYRHSCREGILVVIVGLTIVLDQFDDLSQGGQFRIHAQEFSFGAPKCLYKVVDLRGNVGY